MLRSLVGSEMCIRDSSSFGFTAGGGSSRGPTPYGSYQNTPVRGLAPGDSRNQHPPLSSSGSGGGDTQESMRAMIAAAQQHLIDLQRRLDGGNSTPPPTAAHSHRGTPQQQQYQPTSLSAAVAQGVTSGDMRAVSPSYAHQHHDAGRVGSGSGGGGTLASESERISKAWATLDKRKRKLREHKDRMENARADWRMDMTCLLYTSDAADEEDSVDLGGRRIIKKKKKKKENERKRIEDQKEIIEE
eukprot:TRINITY_DN23553_c0_g1_i4.p1 TRINITY_DN23553_c0_g1~~TRINITY_DN23553_c0_g1_i4.p1  ORF type:complete len:244 (-),score=73.77 TRINITY_DN23553_c0_g1_i4:59-790(-)